MSQAGPQSEEQQVTGREGLQLKVEARIRRLERVSGNGLWSMLLFLIVSFAAYNGFSILPDLSDDVRKILGASPPVELIALHGADACRLFYRLLYILPSVWSASG